MSKFMSILGITLCVIGACIIMVALLLSIAELGNKIALKDKQAAAEYDRVYQLCIIKAHETKQPWEMIGDKCVINANL